MQARIFQVDKVDLAQTPKGSAVISASGTVPTSGWRNGELQPRIYIAPPRDGLWDWDFVATPPSGVSLQVISPIAAQTTPFLPPTWFKGVRVHSSTNAIERTMHQLAVETLFVAGEADGGVDVFPWVVTPLRG